jgi:hypothetical protein
LGCSALETKQRLQRLERQHRLFHLGDLAPTAAHDDSPGRPGALSVLGKFGEWANQGERTSLEKKELRTAASLLREELDRVLSHAYAKGRPPKPWECKTVWQRADQLNKLGSDGRPLAGIQLP